MLLLNRTLIRMAKGLWGWIFVIAGLKLAVLAGTAAFARIISGFLGNVASPELTAAGAWQAVKLNAREIESRNAITLFMVFLQVR